MVDLRVTIGFVWQKGSNDLDDVGLRFQEIPMVHNLRINHQIFTGAVPGKK